MKPKEAPSRQSQAYRQSIIASQGKRFVCTNTTNSPSGPVIECDINYMVSCYCHKLTRELKLLF